jgi:transcriptional regulator with XRE-family HTH domain
MGSEGTWGEALAGAPVGLGDLVRRFRDRAMLSQQALAERSGLSPRTVRALEIGQVRRPHAESIRLLSLALDLGPADREALVRSARTPRRPRPPPTRSAAPAELPPSPADFTGRRRELARLDRTLAARPGDPAVRIALVVGTAGVGKTALAVQWARRVRGAFPDGQLYVDLRGFAPGPPLAPHDALARMLRSLDTPADRIPADPEEAAGLFRTLLAGRRALVLLDNAADADQVRPLLPADPDCCALVTSRDSLAGLVASHGACRVALDVLDAREAVDLLARVVGDGRVGAQPDAARRLAQACEHLPLALRVAAANLTTRPDQDLAAYATALHIGGRLAGLDVDGDPQGGVRAAFDRSYVRLDEPLRRLFRQLSLAPGADITPPAAAALVGDPLPVVARRLDRLVAAYLLRASGTGRYAFVHDLLREYAVEQITAHATAAAAGLAPARTSG